MFDIATLFKIGVLVCCCCIYVLILKQRERKETKDQWQVAQEARMKARKERLELIDLRNDIIRYQQQNLQDKRKDFQQ